MKSNPLQEIIIKCWSDSEFKDEFINNPIEVLSKYGVNISDKVKHFKIVENTPDMAHIVIPASPNLAELDEEELKDMADKLLVEQYVFPTVLAC